MNMKAQLAAISLSVAVSVGRANAADWAILSTQEARCYPASTFSFARSPAVYEQWLRGRSPYHAGYSDTHVTRGPDGKVALVVVTSTNGQCMLFYPSVSICESQLAISLHNGILTDPKELQ
jgi:hypothetical protein